MKKHLVITTAIVDNGIESFQIRKNDYINSIENALRLKKHFDTITIVEATEQSDDTLFLEKFGIPVYYSEAPFTKDKSVGELNMMQEFLDNSGFEDNDIIVKLAGRYLIQHANILRYFQGDIDIVAKDADIYEIVNGPQASVYTFLMAFKKKVWKKISSTYRGPQIEKHICEFIKKQGKRGIIMDKMEKLGIITTLFAYDHSTNPNSPKFNISAPNYLRRYV